MARKVSLKDVALHVGVSTALVSYVLNNKEKKARVSVDTVKRIRLAAEELQYTPNLIAKSLKSGRTNTIGLIVADISNPFFSNIARIIEDDAKKHGYIVIFGSSDESHEKSENLINVFLDRQVDGFIIAPAANTENQLRKLKELNVPFVLIDRYFPGLDSNTIQINNAEAAFQAVQHLIKAGRKKIAMVSYDLNLPHIEARSSGYFKALKGLDKSVAEELYVKASYYNIATDVADKLHGLLFPKLKIDAVFFATNSLAIEGLKKIIAMGIRVPDELAVMSFDQTDAFDFFYAPISYVSQPITEIGREAVRLIVSRIEDNSARMETKVLEATVMIRESAGEIPVSKVRKQAKKK